MRAETLKSILLSAASMAVFAVPIPALAQVAGGQAAAPDEAGATAAAAVSQVVVTANRSATPIDQVGQSVTVLTGADIRQDQETSVSDILARTPGVTFDRNGGVGQTTSIFIRGADSDQTVALIDGVKVNDPTDPGTGFDFANLISGDIARIEVLRGPQSTLYGSEAIGGVVNVITADATKPLQGNLQAEGGSYGTAYVNGAVGGKEDRLDWRLGAYYQSTIGVSAFDQAFGGREPDGYRTAGASGRFRYDLTGDLQLDERVYYSWSHTAFDGYDTPTGAFGDDNEYAVSQQLVDYTGLNLSLLDGRLKNRLAYEYSGVDHDDQDPNQPQNLGVDTTTTYKATGRTYTVEYEGTFAIAPGYQAVFGAQNERSTLVSQSPAFEPAPIRANSTITSGYGQVSGQVLPGLTLTGGARYDEQTNVGGHATGQASAAWSLNGGNTILRASFGQGFKAPSLYQLYSEYGNAALRPEQANGWDAGIEQHFLDGRVVVQASYFGRDTTNLIEFVSCFGVTAGLCAANVSGGYYANVARARAEGVELQASWKATQRLQLSANYTLDDVEDRSPGSPTEGYQLARRPKDTANLTADYVWPIKLKTDVAVRYASSSFDDDAHTILLKSYTLLDLRAAYPINDTLELYGRIENLTDQHYETVYQYGTLGRAVYAGVRLQF
jgi:vitamin B12 transporter